MFEKVLARERKREYLNENLLYIVVIVIKRAGGKSHPQSFGMILAEHSSHCAITAETKQNQNPDNIASTSAATTTSTTTHDAATVITEQQNQDQPKTTVIAGLCATSTTTTYTTTIGCC